MKHEALISGFIILFVGISGCMMDFYLGEQDLIPNWMGFKLFDKSIYDSHRINIGRSRTQKEYRFTLNPMWFLFVVYGMIVFIVEVLQLKSKDKINVIMIKKYYEFRLKLNEGMSEYYEWKNNKRNSKG